MVMNVAALVLAIVRNPIFSAMVLTAVGFALLVPNVIAVVAVVLLVLAIELQVRYVEEPHLQEHNGRHAATRLDDRATS